MKVLPVIQPHVNWRTLIDTCREFNGERPTGNVDTLGLSLGDPGALPVFLDPELKDRSLKVSYFSFLVVASPLEYTRITTYISNTHIIHSNDSSVLFIVTANILDWKIAIKEGHKEFPEFFEQTLIIFERTYLKHIFKFKKRYNQGAMLLE